MMNNDKKKLIKKNAKLSDPTLPFLTPSPPSSYPHTQKSAKHKTN